MAEDIKSLEEKLNLLIRVVAAQCVAGKGATESIKTLGRLGIGRDEIARICDTTPNTVSVRLSEAKREGGKGRRRT
jgi:hypothetical protein